MGPLGWPQTINEKEGLCPAMFGLEASLDNRLLAAEKWGKIKKEQTRKMDRLRQIFTSLCATRKRVPDL